MYENNFLLHNKVAKELYANICDMPIIDYHNHLDPKEIYENIPFKNITEMWLDNDHYKWRLIRFSGNKWDNLVSEKNNIEKFKIFASSIETAYLNPLYDWSHMELKTFFKIDKHLNKDNAEDIYKEANEYLMSNQFGPADLLKNLNVEILCTTDDLNDDLNYHKLIALDNEIKIKVLPTFRPDNLFSFNKETFKDTIIKLENNTDSVLSKLDSLLIALSERLDFFAENSCKLADHGITYVKYHKVNKKETTEIYSKRYNNQDITDLEIEKLNIFLLRFLLKEYTRRKWTVQYHIGALRDNNKKGFNELGKDSGYDSISSYNFVDDFNLFLNEVNLEYGLPRMIIYPLQKHLYEAVASMCANFSEGEVGKIQLGAAWWFNDHLSGIEKQLSVFAEYLHINYFLGMVTDSRSYLSFIRHDYFRRVLVNFLGKKVELGLIPNNMKMLIQIVKDISYNNSKKFLNL